MTATTAIGTLIRNVDFQLCCSSSAPASSGPAAIARPAVAVHSVIALARSRAREGRREQRERRGHDQGGADAHHGAGGDDPGGAVDEAARRPAPPPKTNSPEHQRAAAAVLVSDRAEQQHQRRVRDGVAVDDPLQVRAGQAQILGHVGRGDGQGGVRHHDDQQAQAQDQERPPAPGVGPVHPLDRFVHDESHVRDRLPHRVPHRRRINCTVMCNCSAMCNVRQLHSAVQMMEMKRRWRDDGRTRRACRMAAMTTGPTSRADANRRRILDVALAGAAARPRRVHGPDRPRRGVVRRTVYGHFPSREALVGTLVDGAVESVAAAHAMGRDGVDGPGGGGGPLCTGGLGGRRPLSLLVALAQRSVAMQGIRTASPPCAWPAWSCCGAAWRTASSTRRCRRGRLAYVQEQTVFALMEAVNDGLLAAARRAARPRSPY